MSTVNTIKPSNFTNDLKAGDQVALIYVSRTGKTITGLKTPITISKIKENGHVYLKGESAPNSVPFKFNSKNELTYTKSEMWSSVDYCIIPMDVAQASVDASNLRKKIKETYANATSFVTNEEMEAIINLLASMREPKGDQK